MRTSGVTSLGGRGSVVVTTTHDQNTRRLALALGKFVLVLTSVARVDPGAIIHYVICKKK